MRIGRLSLYQLTQEEVDAVQHTLPGGNARLAVWQVIADKYFFDLRTLSPYGSTPFFVTAVSLRKSDQ